MLPVLKPEEKGEEQRRAWASDAAALSALAAFTIVVFWKIVLTRQFTWADGPDYVNQVLPWLQEQARQWRSGAFPLWDSRHWGGYPFVGQAQPGVLFPLNWLLAWMPDAGRLTLAHLNWYFALIHYLGAASAYALCRELRCSRAAAILGGITFGLGGFIGNLGWPQMLNGAIFAPVVLLFLFRSAEGRRPVLNAAISGALLGLSLWSGHHQIPMFIALAAMLLLVHAGGSRALPWRVVAPCAAAFGGLAFLVGAPQLLPSREFFMDALRWVNTQDAVTWKDRVQYAAHMQFSLSPAQLPGLILPHWHGNVVLYVGVTVFALAGFAVYRRWDAFATRYCTLMGVAFLVFSFGYHTPLHGVLYAIVPDLDKSRNVAFAVSMVHVALTVLAAVGLDAVRTGWQRREPYVRTFGRIAGGVSCLLYGFIVAVSLVRPDAHNDPLLRNGSIAALAAGLLAAFVMGPWSGRLTGSFSVWALVGLVVLETGTMTGSVFRHREQGWQFMNQLSANDDIAEFLRGRVQDGRIAYSRDEVPYNFGDWYGFEDTDGYISPLTNAFRFGHAQGGALMSARYRISKKPRFEGQELVFQGRSGLNVYAEPYPFPRAWSVHRAVSAGSPGEIEEFLRRRREELRQTASFNGPAPRVDSCPDADIVEIRSLAPTRIRIDAGMKCAGAVILSNAYARGWRVTVDGREQRLYEAYGFLQAVGVEAGRHTIEFRYVPSSLYAGVGLAAAGLVALVALGRLTSW